MRRDGKIGFAACAVELNVQPGQLQLFPQGKFNARDGRPGKDRSWLIDATIAQQVIDAAKARQTPFVIDYEHQTLNAEKNGQPAPAAGWFKQVQWRDGQGLFAVDVQWTDKAKAMIEAGEYKFISPVFSYATDGAVLELHMAALTNYPAIDGMEMLAAAKFQSNQDEEDLMFKKFLALLGLSETATEDEAIAAVTALKSDLTEQTKQVAALKAKPPADPDPAKFVPVSVVAQIQTELAALKSQMSDTQVNDLVTAALADGRLLPAMEAWARELGKKDLAALKGYIDSAQPIAALSGLQTGGKGPQGDPNALDAAAIAVCKAMGISTEDYKKTQGLQG